VGLEYQGNRVAVFGLFRFDLSSKDLTKNGIRLRLEEKPALVLNRLIEGAGTVVTRDELQRLLWPNGVHVDFDHGLNKAVNRLRGVLGDDRDEPRYIETLSRRGYRFIAQVQFEKSAKLADVAEALRVVESSHPGYEPAVTTGSDPLDLRQPERKSLWLMLAGISAIVLVAGLTLALGVHSRRRLPLTQLDTIVLADFDNKTGDSVFDSALKQALAIELEQSPFLNVLSDRKISETLRMMGHPATERITMDISRDLCVRTGSKAVLGGTISSIGDDYVIYLDATACSTGDIIAKEQVEARGKENVLKALSQASSGIRGKLGESLPSVQKYDVPIQVTTSSLDALESYSMGIRIFREKGNAPSIPFFERAIELDSNFPMAYVSLAIAHGNQGEQTLPAELAKKAYQLRDRATEFEKFRIDALYFSSTGELEKENQTYELCIANYPRDPIAHNNLGSSIAFTTGQSEKALAEYQEALRLAPGVLNIYENLALTYLSLNRLDDANTTIEQALARNLDGATLRQMMYYLGFLRGDAPRMERLVAWTAGQPGTEDLLLSLQSDTEAYYGHINTARQFSLRATESALSAGSLETAATWRVNAALREAELGNAALARQGVADALKLSSGRLVRMQAALALARLGDAREAKALAEGALKSEPSFVMLKFYWFPLIDAAIELERGDADKALMELESASLYESHQLGHLYPAYERGQAYLLAHNGTAAAVEFQKLFDHRGLVMNFVTGSLAHLQIARAYAMQGDTAKARAAYQDFVTFWKDADADIPILKQAKAEYAKLQ
jgi:eukaryotic-like serine/threonine-protein kinase